MSDLRPCFDLLTRVLSYPTLNLPNDLDALAQQIADILPDTSKRFAKFADSVRNLNQTELEELFTKTFDLNPVCSLEIGWHLFGEEYARGLLMVRLRQEMRRHGVQENGELPDHLTHIVQLLKRMDPDEGNEFAVRCVLPALEKMVGAIKENSTPFDSVVYGVSEIITHQFPAAAITNFAV